MDVCSSLVAVYVCMCVCVCVVTHAQFFYRGEAHASLSCINANWTSQVKWQKTV